MCNFKQGEYIKVSNGGTLKKRIFIGFTDNDEVIAVHSKDEDAFRNGEYFRVGTWSVAEDLEPKFGDEVEVSNGGAKFSSRIFLGRVGDRILTVDERDRDLFDDGMLTYRTALWNMLKD